MCTKPRIVAADHIYEISSRGARGCKIFFNDELKAFFLKELAHTLKKYSFKCYAWNIMDDHYHLVVRSSEISISIFMQRLNSIYAKHFNNVTNGSGVVFHKRFASVIIEDGKLRKLIRYVHLNPVRSQKCCMDELARYQWCGHGVILNKVTDHFQNVEDILGLFPGTDPIKEYSDFVQDGRVDAENDLMIKLVRMANRGLESFSKAEPWVLGCAEFIKNVLEMDRCRRIRIARFIRENITLELIQSKIEENLKLPIGALYRQGRQNTKATARYLFSYIGRFRYDFPMVRIASYLGVSCSAISKMITKYITQKRVTAIEQLFEGIPGKQKPEIAISIG